MSLFFFFLFFQVGEWGGLKGELKKVFEHICIV